MKVFSTFSGIGGFEIGIERAFNNRPNLRDRSALLPEDSSDTSESPLRFVGYSEIDKYAIKVYEKQFGGTNESASNKSRGEQPRKERQHERSDVHTESIGKPTYNNGQPPRNYGDITKINAEELPDFDCLVGGFPCQAFSIAGKRKGFEDTRGTLFFDLARILRAKQPRLFVFENVKGLLSHDSGRTFKTIIQTIDELGYDCQWQVLNSKNFGVPQNRERVYIVGHLRGTPRPEVFPITGDGGEDTRLSGHISNTLTARYEGAQAVGTYIGESKLDAQEVKIRRLTPIECERLQGFPDNWTAEGTDGPISDTQRYKMCGNAVTVNVVEAVFERILK